MLMKWIFYDVQNGVDVWVDGQVNIFFVKNFFKDYDFYLFNKYVWFVRFKIFLKLICDILYCCEVYEFVYNC